MTNGVLQLENTHLEIEFWGYAGDLLRNFQ